MRGTLIIFLMIFLVFSKSYADERCYIQIASFKYLKNANRYFEYVREIPYRVIMTKVDKLYAIRIGPFKENSCKKFHKELLKKFKDCIIIKTDKENLVKENKIFKSEKQKLLEQSSPERKRLNPNSKKQLQEIYIEKAKVCMGKKDCMNAIKYLKLAISLGDRSARTFTYLGYAYYHVGDYIRAIETFKKALEIDKNYPEGYEGIGLSYLKLNSPHAAAIALKKAYELNPDEISYGINLAVAYLSSGDLESSLSVLNQLEEKYPLIPEVHYNRALVLMKSGKNKEAVKELETFTELANSPYYEAYVQKVKLVIKSLKGRKCEKERIHSD